MDLNRRYINRTDIAVGQLQIPPAGYLRMKPVWGGVTLKLVAIFGITLVITVRRVFHRRGRDTDFS